MVATVGIDRNGNRWHLAPCLVALVRDADAVAPNRVRVSDGTIGDQYHAARTSDHNPDSTGVVSALDLTHDPVHGFDTWKIARMIAAAIEDGEEKRVKYLISGDPTRRGDLIFHNVGPHWQWDPSPYTNGTHVGHHLHVSVVADATQRSNIQQWPIYQPAAITPPEADQVFLIQRGTGGAIAATNFITKRALGPSQLAAFRTAYAAAEGAQPPVTVVTAEVFDAIPS
jgi:hypothetical protein